MNEAVPGHERNTRRAASSARAAGGAQDRFHVLVMRELETRGLGRSFEKLLEQLRRGDFRSADVKKLRGAELYRAKLDEKNRLLFKLGEHGGRTVLLVLEIVHNHAYEKARFLNGGSYSEADFEPIADAALQGAPGERMTYVHPTAPALHVLDKPLSFDDAQAAVFETPLPLIVVGSAGSGKTALTLEKLKTVPGHGLYLTRSSYLVESARTLYYANGYANPAQEVEFLSLAELIETIDVPRGREARWADFVAWFARMRGAFRLREPHRIFEEIKGVITGAAERAPYLSEAEYLALGVRQTIFLGEERQQVYQLFQRWLEHLGASSLFDPNMAAWERRERAPASYDFLVIDEVQDITLVELRLALATLRDPSCFLLCGDSNQIVHPNLFSWAKVKSLFFTGDAASSPLDQIHILSANYRNTRAVTALANRLLLIKQRRFGSVDRESNYLVDCVSGELGRVELAPNTPAVRAEIEAKTRRSARTAVIVLRDEDKAAARAAFSTPLVFSVQESKGLEYENVVLFDLVSAAAREFRECTDGVRAADLEGELVYARARDKTDKSLDAYKFYPNALYVAITRAVRSLVIVEREPTHPLFELLAIDRISERLELASEESSREEWQREARRLELQGKTEQADQIRREILGCQPVPWPVIDAASFPETRKKALGPGPTERAAQQLLFEYALTYDAQKLIPALAAAGFKHAKRPESGLEYIEQTHYREYRYKSSGVVDAHIRKHGVDFRNPLNETPLMVAARVGRGDRVRELLAQGADPELRDTAGRNALRVAIAGFLDQRGVKPNAFAEVYQALAVSPLKVKHGPRMTKLDPRSMEWFLLNVCLVLFRRMSARARERSVPVFNAPALVATLAGFPPAVLPDHRKRREYLSSMLSKNELYGTNPYNRRLFLRIERGAYVLNPALEIEVAGAWLPIGEAMELPQLLDALGPDREWLKGWFEKTRRTLTPELDQAPPP